MIKARSFKSETHVPLKHLRKLFLFTELFTGSIFDCSLTRLIAAFVCSLPL